MNDQNNQVARVKYLKSIAVVTTVVFLLLIAISIYCDISWHRPFHLRNILLLLILIATFFYKSKISWTIAIFLFAYGIYYYLFVRTRIAYPGVFQFTLPLIELQFGDKHGYKTGNPLIRYFALLPFVFYLVSTVIFITKPVRKLYWAKTF